MSSSRPESALRQLAQEALQQGEERAALGLFLELDDRFDPDHWVLFELAASHKRLAQPERGLVYANRCRALNDTAEIRSLIAELEHEHEVWYRNLARLAHIDGKPGQALDLATTAAQVAEPVTWTIRVLVDAAVASNRRDEARPVVARVRAKRPDDNKLLDLEQKLDA